MTAVAPTGTTADAFRDDFATLLSAYLAANYPIGGLVIIMTSQQALKLGLMRNTLGQKEFPDLRAAGGSVEGVPIITSENIPAAGSSPVDGYPIIALHAPSILLADDGGVNIDMSREASLQMDSAPDSPASGIDHHGVAVPAEPGRHQGRAVHHLEEGAHRRGAIHPGRQVRLSPGGGAV